MRKYLFTLFFLFVINRITIYPQNYKSSIITEFAGLATHQGEPLSNSENNGFLTGFSLSYSGLIRLGHNYQLEFRPGYFFTFQFQNNETIYSKYHLGVFLRRKLIDSTFFAIGISPEISFKSQFTISLGVTAGLKLDESTSILLSYYKPLIEKYGYTKGFGNNYLTSIRKDLYWLIKLGFELHL